MDENDDKGIATQVDETLIQSNIKKSDVATVRKNPLSEFSSYTYNLSLYMITPDAYNDFEASGRRNINDFLGERLPGTNQITKGGAYLICQSGGIGVNEARAPGFDLDYYIDNLKIKSLVNPAATGSSTFTTTFEFNITEPYGFSFYKNLKIASDSIARYSKAFNLTSLTNPTRQLFILGIKFRGYDSQGNVINSSSEDENGLFATYYPIIIKGMRFKLDGSAVNYSIMAVSIGPNEALTQKRATLNTNTNIEAATIEEALKKIETAMTQKQIDLDYGSGGPINTFAIKIVDDFSDFKNARIVSAMNNQKIQQGFADVRNSNQVNEQTAKNAIPNPTKKNISFSNGSSVLQAIERVVVQSSFLTDALNVVYDSISAPDPNKKDYDGQNNNGKEKELSWYNVSTSVKCLGYNTVLNDLVWDITYIITPYKTPITLSPYVIKAAGYYGAVKRYNYWFTGENSEVISYEQTNNNGYYITVLKPDSNINSKSGEADIPIVPGQPVGGDTQGTQIISQQTMNSVTTNLHDPKSYSDARINIMGDPDLLMYDKLSPKALTVYNQFYDYNNSRINPYNGQVFVEVNFKEAVDYDNSRGTLDINDQITFWQYPENIKDLVPIVEGVSFLLISINHSFNGGRFTQELICRINTFPWIRSSKSNTVQQNSSESQRQESVTQQENAGVEPAPPIVGMIASSIEKALNAFNNGVTSNTGFKQNPVTSAKRALFNSVRTGLDSLKAMTTASPDDPGSTKQSTDSSRE